MKQQVNEQTDFDEILIKQVLNTVSENCLPVDKPVYVDQINELANKIADDSMKELQKLKKLFKWSITVFIQQKNGCAMNFGSAQYWEDLSDGCLTVPILDHPHVDVLISIAGVKITQK